MAAKKKSLLNTVDAAIQFVNNCDFNLKYDETVNENENENLISKLPFSPAAERNKAPIFEQLKNFLPESGTVLEIGSRHGQHCQYFGEQIYSTDLKTKIQCKWQPTDYIDECFNQIEQRRGFNGDCLTFLLCTGMQNHPHKQMCIDTLCDKTNFSNILSLSGNLSFFIPL